MKTFNNLIFIFLCGMIFASCGGESSSKSGLKKNRYLGSLPAIYADYNATIAAHEAKIEKQGMKLMSGGEKNSEKIMTLMQEDQATVKIMKDKLKTDVNAEIAKIVGKDVFVAYSKSLIDSDELFYNVASAKLGDNKGELAIAIVLSAKNDFEVPRMKGYDYSAYFKLITTDGSIILKSVLLPVKLDYKAFSIASGELLLENNFPLYISGNLELYANFAGMEFISKDEYNEL